ncbi:MAG TPA: hypothetical protein VIM16_06490 [Mucilaginibacter sp.]
MRLFSKVANTGGCAYIGGETPPCHFTTHRAPPEGGNFSGNFNLPNTYEDNSNKGGTNDSMTQ